MNRVKHFLILVLALTMNFGAWAQTNTTVQVTKDNNLDWNFTMPDYDAVVGVEYYPYTLTLIASGNGTVGFSGDTLPQGVTAGTTANTYLVVPGTEVCIKARANENYVFGNWTNENSNVMGTDSTLTLTITGDTTLTANFVRDFEGSGTEDDPYLIPNTEKWTLLSTRVKEGKGYYGKYFLQTDSIFAGRIYVGTYYSATSYRPFGGIYDGGGHALEFLDNNISSMNKENRAPFICVDGATIQNLHITGTIKTYYHFIAGFIARTVTNNRTTTIINCRSSIRIESLRPGDYDGTHGGFVAVTDAAVNLIGCVFDGELIGAETRSSGGFIGWTDKHASVHFKDCIFAPKTLTMGDSLSCTFSRARREDTSLHFSNCYYAKAYGKEQGKKLRSFTAGTDVTTLGLTGNATEYNVSGITAYAGNNGLKYGDMFFAGDTDVVNLTLGHTDRTTEGLIFDSYSASNGATINGETLTMPNDSTVISANYFQCPMLTLASNGNGTVGFCGDTLPQGVTPGSTANTYYVVSGTEVCIKTTADTGYLFTGWNDQNTDNPRSITVTSNTTFTANFVVETYTVTLNDGGVDATHWTGKVGDDANVGFSAFPLENVEAAQTVTVKYDGMRKVKSITLVPVNPEPAGPTLSTPLTMKAITAGTIAVNNPPQGMQYSLNGGAKTPVTTTAIEVSVGDSVAFYGDGTNITSYNGTTISGGTAQVKVYGNIMSLVDETEFATAAVLSNDYVFRQLFKGYNSLTDASGLKLPATILTSGCYSYMFYNCENMASAPTLLPATILVNSCYNGMFYGCSSLTSTPELPATTLTPQCYYCMFSNCTSLTATPALPATTVDELSCYQMFYNCSSLTTVPDTLPATTLASQCYSGMFSNCYNLTTAPALPATTLAEGCYIQMFYMCSHLTTAPELPAPTLTYQCYHRMFGYCNQLNSVTCLATTFAANSTHEWLDYVATSGTFTKAANANWEEGASGIPSGWTTVNSSNSGN